MASRVDSLGDIPFTDYRAFRTMTRQATEPYRFVDGELIERFLTCEPAVQKEIVDIVGSSLEEVRAIVETLRRLH
jgi:DNA damage-binding protein 1